MIDYQDIRSVHFEISTRCNSTCPDCPRNFRGANVIDTYPVVDMSLKDAKRVFSPAFLEQLDHITINGNYGDFVTARDGLAIVEYFRSSNPGLRIEISTNGSAQPNLWEPLARTGARVYFRLDGLKDTHHLYRQGTDFDFILKNAGKFIAAGGEAVWSMIVFDHNRHQVAEARQMSKDLGFCEFDEVYAGRDIMPVFTNDGRLSHVIGDYRGSTDFKQLFETYNYYKIDPNVAVRAETTSRPIDCYSKRSQEVYVCANGEVYPCCWLGNYPTHSCSRPSNAQLQPLIKNNNAIEYGLVQAIEWFNEIEKTWAIDTVPNGKIYECNQTCGIKTAT